MKRCPQCRRDYYDETLLYCLDDGTALLEGPASFGGGTDEPATALLRDVTARPAADVTSEPATRVLTTTMDSLRPRIDKRLLAGLAIVVVALAAFALYRYTSTDKQLIRSIAVLPFENANADTNSEYLSDGLAESLIYRLSQLPDLNVSPRSSVFRYKGQTVDAERIGNELNVDAVMSGRVIQRGDNLTISVDLVDVRNRKTIWGEQFERKLSDLLSTQREIATAIADKLQLKLSGADSKGITKQYTNSNEAYQLYLQGRYFWNKRTEDALKRAIELLNSAVEKDPGFALAYAALADCYVVLPTYSGRRSTEAMPQAIAYARRSIEIDPTLAEPHATLGLAIWFYQWDKDAAESEFKKAVELNPNYGTTHHWYSRFLRSVARNDEAWKEINRAVELDPLSLIFLNNVAEQQIERGEFQAAEETCRRMRELDSNMWAVRQTLVWLYVKQGKFDAALGQATEGIELSGRANASVAQLGHVYARLGRRAEAEALLRELEEKYSKGAADPALMAIVHTGLGQNDQAFEWLEKAFQAKSFTMASLPLDPLLEPLRSDPRWADLKRRIGLP